MRFSCLYTSWSPRKLVLADFSRLLKFCNRPNLWSKPTVKPLEKSEVNLCEALAGCLVWLNGYLAEKNVSRASQCIPASRTAIFTIINQYSSVWRTKQHYQAKFSSIARRIPTRVLLEHGPFLYKMLYAMASFTQSFS